LPSVTDRTLPFNLPSAELPSQMIDASLEVGRAWTEAYFDGLEKTLEFQRGAIEAYRSATHRYLNAAGDSANRAEQAGSDVIESVAVNVREAATKQAKAVESVAGNVRQAAKKQAEAVTGPTDEPLAGYDELTAEQVVAKLPTLSQRELAKVDAYERFHQARQTVLARVESLTGDEPVSGYDELTVAEIQKLLTDGDEDLAKRVRDYERGHSARNGVLQAAERQLKQS